MKIWQTDDAINVEILIGGADGRFFWAYDEPELSLRGPFPDEDAAKKDAAITITSMIEVSVPGIADFVSVRFT